MKWKLAKKLNEIQKFNENPDMFKEWFSIYKGLFKRKSLDEA